MTSRKGRLNHEAEGRLLLAIKAVKSKQIASIRAAAKTFDVPRSTLTDRVRGRSARVDSIPNGRKLSNTEEEVLLKWILSMDSRGLPPTITMTRYMANLLLSQRLPSASIGTKWTNRFIERHSEIQSKYNRKFDYQRRQCESREVMGKWFNVRSS